MMATSNSYIIKRVFWAIPTIVLVSVLAFLLSRSVPNNSAQTLLQLQGVDVFDSNYEQEYDKLIQQLKLDKPIFYLSVETRTVGEGGFHYPVLHLNGFDNQYHYWMKDIFQGNFGKSIIDGKPAINKINQALKWTLFLLFWNIILTLVCSTLLGVYNGFNKGSIIDVLSDIVLTIIYALPLFWLATMALVFFTNPEYGMWWFKSTGYWYSDESSFLKMAFGSFGNFVLPLILLVLADCAYLSRMIRNGVIEELKEDYVQVARAKGMSELQIAKKHVLRNALTPSITLISGAIPNAIGGSLIIEVIFNIPGVGRLLLESIKLADWNIVFGIIILVSLITVVFFILGDLIVAKLNPKVNLDK